MNFDFGNVLTRAGQIIWKHKVLWIFGIFASCSRGNGGGSSGGGNSGFNGGSNPDQFGQGMEQAGQWLQNNLWIIVVVIIALLLLALLFTALGVIGRIALIKGTHKAEHGSESMSFGELWSESLPYFWRVFGLTFLIGLALMVLFVPLILFGVLTAGVGFMCILPLLCILVPFGIVLGIVVEQANAAIVLEDLGMADGFKRGWEIVRNNPGATILMALILGVGSGIAGLILAVPFVIALMPVIFGAMSETNALVGVGVLCACAYFPVLLALSGMITAYVQSAWTLTYMRLAPSRPADALL